MSKESEFWQNRHLEHSISFSCPNPTLFRMLSSDFKDHKEIKVLELGFGGNDGADLIEFKRRGAKLCIGIDINDFYVSRLNQYATDRKVDNLSGYTVDVTSSVDIRHILKTSSLILFSLKDSMLP